MAALKVTVDPLRVNPSLGWPVPELGFWTTPFIEIINCCAFVGALATVNWVRLLSKLSEKVEIKKLPILCTSSHAVLVPLYTNIFPVDVLKNMSPESSADVGLVEPTR